MREDDKYLIRLKRLILDFLRDYDVKVFLFGSRARSDSRDSSDVDIGLLPGAGFKLHLISLLREAIEESTIPYKVDVINLNETSPEFREEVLKEGVVWKG